METWKIKNPGSLTSAQIGDPSAIIPVKASFGNWRRALETVWQDLETGLQDLETGLQDLETEISPRIWKLVRRALETGGLGYFIGFMCVCVVWVILWVLCVCAQFPNPGGQFPNPGGPVSKSWRPVSKSSSPVSKSWSPVSKSWRSSFQILEASSFQSSPLP